jgi:hypothetical protein
VIIILNLMKKYGVIGFITLIVLFAVKLMTKIFRIICYLKFCQLLRLKFGVWRLAFDVWRLRFDVWPGLGLGAWGLGLGAWDLGLGTWDLRL